MPVEKPYKGKRWVYVVVCLVTLLFLVIAVVLGLLAAREMMDVVGRKFAQQQLIIARNVSHLIEREIDLLRKEIVLLAEGTSEISGDKHETIRNVASSLFGRGVSEIDVVDLDNKKTDVYTSHGHRSADQPAAPRGYKGQHPHTGDDRGVWVSPPQIKASGISVKLAKSLPGDSRRLLVFTVNVSRMVSPFLKKIRPGKTGYAWIIDQNGTLLFHPEADFVGKNVYGARSERDIYVSYEKIIFAQKERMLKGEEGTGWYISGWHRQVAGRIRKLIAYCPIVISGNPPQNWSVAVVTPVSEIEEPVHSGYLGHFLLQAILIFIVLLNFAGVVIAQIKWSRALQERVTEQRYQLRITEEKYRSLVESADDFIFTVDSDGFFQSMNTFTASFFNGQPEDFLGKSLSSLFPPEITEKQLRHVRQVYKFSKTVGDELVLKMGDRRIWISANFIPVRDKEGKIASVLCICRDITEKKEMEAQLTNAEKLASIGTLAAGVAHEINNPLGVIIGFCDLLLDKTPDGSQLYEDLKIVQRQGLHCRQVVENLLSFARPGMGQLEYADLNMALKEIINVVRPALDKQNIELVLELAEDIPQVKGDSRQLQQVFLNLINNAAAATMDACLRMPVPGPVCVQGSTGRRQTGATHRQGGRLHIRTSMEKGGQKAIIQFQDNGVGINEEDMDHIFEPFFTTKPEGEGTGLGLFVSYGIIARYGGSIRCVSHTADSPGKPTGTTFIIRLPVRDDHGKMPKMS